MAFNLLLFAFGYFNAILSSHVSFLLFFFLIFVLLIKGYTKVQEKDHACHVRDNHISRTEK